MSQNFDFFSTRNLLDFELLAGHLTRGAELSSDILAGVCDFAIVPLLH